MIDVQSPSGTAWEFLILFAVVIVGPPLMQRARVPGIVGLLVGGFAIGPHGLDLIGAGDTTVPELGQLGLLYLMFVAGVELDLGLVRVHRNSVVGFAAIAFATPMALGSAVGTSLGWNVPATLLLGALLASHTLLLYPTARGAGLAADRGVATAVGATVLTDTATLTVLAAVSGSQLAGGSALSIAVQIVVGLAVLVAFALLVLPRLARLAFRYLGTDRIVRYLIAVASFLAAATVAESFGVEGIVGAFFAGLALNRLVPNEGPLMDRIDFFGAAVFIPVFLVSVGMLLDPAVMVEGETLKLGGLFILASIGGKAIASGIARLALGYSGAQAELMLGLTVPQAAAALAATIVGFEIGLFGQSVVNAVLILILASIVVGTILVDRSVKRVPPPERSDRLGRRVLVTVEDPAQAPLAFSLARLIAAPDNGVVHGLLSSPPSEAQSRHSLLAELGEAAFAADLDAEPALLVHDSLPEGIVNAAAAERASLVLVGQHPEAATAFGSAGEAIAAATPVPVAILIGEAERIGSVLLSETVAPDGAGATATQVAGELAARLGNGRVAAPAAGVDRLRPGELCVMPAASWELLADPPDPPAGAAVLVVPEN
jgi:Kef-type K+ transport system membrane component KefB